MIEAAEVAGNWAGAGAGAGFGFFFVRWLATFVAGRWDKREALLDESTTRLISQLNDRLESVSTRLNTVETDLATCKQLHAEAEARALRLEAMLQGKGDAAQHAALIIAAERAKDHGETQ